MKLIIISLLLVNIFGSVMAQPRPITPVIPDDENQLQDEKEILQLTNVIHTWKIDLKERWEGCYEDKIAFSGIGSLKDFLAFKIIVPPKLKFSEQSPSEPMHFNPNCSHYKSDVDENLSCLMGDATQNKILKKIIENRHFSTYLLMHEKILSPAESEHIIQFYQELLKDKHK